MRGLEFAFLFFLTFCLLSCGSSLDQTHGAKNEANDSSGAIVSMQLPSISGQSFDLKSVEDKVVLLQFFSTACRSCRLEAKEFQSEIVEGALSKDVVVIGIAVKNSAEEVREWRQSVGVSYELLLDEEGHFFDQMKKTTSFPTIVFLDRSHRVREVKDFYTKIEPTLKKLQALVEEDYEGFDEAVKDEGKSGSSKKSDSAEVDPSLPPNVVHLFVPDICEGACAAGVEYAMEAEPEVLDVKILNDIYRLEVKTNLAQAQPSKYIEMIEMMGYHAEVYAAEKLKRLQEFKFILRTEVESEGVETLQLDLTFDYPFIYQAKFDLKKGEIKIISEKNQYTRPELIEHLGSFGLKVE